MSALLALLAAATGTPAPPPSGGPAIAVTTADPRRNVLQRSPDGWWSGTWTSGAMTAAGEASNHALPVAALYPSVALTAGAAPAGESVTYSGVRLLYGGSTYPVTKEGEDAIVVTSGQAVESDPIGILLAPSRACTIQVGAVTRSATTWTPPTKAATIVAHSKADSWWIVGDSILAGGGWVEPVLRDLGIPYMNISQSGALALTWNDAQMAARGIALGHSRALVQTGANDGGHFAQWQSDSLSLYGRIATATGAPVYQSTLVPRTSSTDSWATVEGQTIAHADHPQFNDWIRDGLPIDANTKAPVAIGATGLRAGQSGHPLTAWVEVGSAVEAAIGSFKWAAGAAYTGDGIHPTGVGHGALAALFKTFAQTL